MAKVGKRSYGEADYDSTKAKKSKSSKLNRQPAQIGDVPDSEEDLGHSTSVKFLAAAKEPAKKSRAAVSTFKNIVEEGKKKLAILVEEKALGVYTCCMSTGWMTSTNLSASPKQDRELTNTFIKVILDAQRDQTEMDESAVKQPSTSKPTATAIYQSAKFNIASSRELLEHFERASQQVAFGKGVPMVESEWEKDNQKLQCILNEQGKRIKGEIHQLLNEDPKSSKQQVRGDTLELDTDLWNKFAVGEAEEGNVETIHGRKREAWAVVAKNAQRGVRRIVKSLPEDGE